MDSSISIGKNLFILYLVISSNFLANLFGCKVQQAFQSNMLLKHFLGFLTLYFFVTLADTSDTLPSDLGHRFGIALIIYLFFILSTRVNFRFWVPSMICLGAIYIIELFKQDEKKKDENQRDKHRIEQFLKAQQILIGISSLLMLIGFIVYVGEKKSEYGRQFQWGTFFFGKTNCKGDKETSNLTTGEAIKRAFIN
jgi:hypothetical protein